jgi:hypothetical protein
MESTCKPKDAVQAALIAGNGDPDEAFLILMKQEEPPTIHKYTIERERELKAFRTIKEDRLLSC